MFVDIRGKNYKVKGKKGSLKLKLQSKQIKEIDEIKNLDNLTDLQSLNLYNNQISEIKGLENLLNLQELNLTQNKITQIKGLERCTNLKTLQMQKNNIKKIEGLEKLTQLEVLDLRSNLIEEIGNFENFENLNKLELGGNPCYIEFRNTFKYYRDYQYALKKKKNLDLAILLYSKQSFEKRKEFDEARKIVVENKKYLGIDMSEIIQKIDKILEYNFLNENQIYYPIEGLLPDSLNKEDIIYSTLCKIRSQTQFQHTNKGLSMEKKIWKSPVLITKEKMFYPCSVLSRTGEVWGCLEWSSNPQSISNPNIKFSIQKFELIRDAKFESKQLFSERRKKFGLFCHLLSLRWWLNRTDLVEFLRMQKLIISKKQTINHILRDILHMID